MRKRYGRAWPLASFFLVYLIQQGMLVGLTLPLYAVFTSRRAWQPAMDYLATAGCLAGEEGPLAASYEGSACATRVVASALKGEARCEHKSLSATPCPAVYQGISGEALRDMEPSAIPVYRSTACAGIGMAAIADNQLFRFMEGNERRLAVGKKPVLLLDTGEKVIALSSLARPNVCHLMFAWRHAG